MEDITIHEGLIRNVEIFWPGKFKISKINNFQKFCSDGNEKSYHTCKSPDDVFILWKRAELIQNQKLIILMIG